MTALMPPDSGDDWVALGDDVLPVAVAADWVVLPSCGASVVFSGTSRDHSGSPDSPAHRVGVTVLEYEAYDEQVIPRFQIIVAELRRQWPEAGRVAVLHRVGPVAVGESSVVVAVSAPHRDVAFAAARFGIDNLKAAVPIWKKETWAGGSAWGLDAQPISDVGDPDPDPDPVTGTFPVPVGSSAGVVAASSGSGDGR